MFIVINKIISYFESLLNFLKNSTKLNLKQTYKNNLGFFKFKFFSDRASRYKFFLYLYIFITMIFCPWLDDLFNNWYNIETYNLYYILCICFFLNFFLNFFLVIPTKNTLEFRNFFLKIKSSYYFINNLVVRLTKIYLFFLNEVFLRSFLFNFFKSNFIYFTNYFTYWRPLFKRFSYFGYFKLVKSKFFKINN